MLFTAATTAAHALAEAEAAEETKTGLGAAPALDLVVAAAATGHTWK